MAFTKYMYMYNKCLPFVEFSRTQSNFEITIISRTDLNIILRSSHTSSVRKRERQMNEGWYRRGQWVENDFDYSSRLYTLAAASTLIDTERKNATYIYVQMAIDFDLYLHRN